MKITSHPMISERPSCFQWAPMMKTGIIIVGGQAAEGRQHNCSTKPGADDPAEMVSQIYSAKLSPLQQNLLYNASKS
ncbi:hypothetical protein EB796_002958 [Bugula neritina]|uniref:Uncharacterized protein n=1 Tax=Bugula neritina TaxID=10212 RepID=A0A7J7KKE7_BUGNE|nr:hypothetical protein EB796_002958 [Bugula neritina]